MNNQLAAKTYQNVQMAVNDQRRILIMAFEGMIKFLHQAKEAMKAKEIETAHERLVRTKQIIFHLLNALDVKKGGEIAENLQRLYLFLIEKITEANLKKDPEIVEEILPIFHNLCSAWEEMVPHTEAMGETGKKGMMRERGEIGNQTSARRVQVVG